MLYVQKVTPQFELSKYFSTTKLIQRKATGLIPIDFVVQKKSLLEFGWSQSNFLFTGLTLEHHTNKKAALTV